MIEAKFTGGSTDKKVFATYLNYWYFFSPESGQGQCGYKPCLLVTSAQPVDVTSSCGHHGDVRGNCDVSRTAQVEDGTVSHECLKVTQSHVEDLTNLLAFSDIMYATAGRRVLLEKTTVPPLMKKVSALLWIPKVPYRVHNSPPSVPTLSQINLVPVFPYFFKIPLIQSPNQRHSQELYLDLRQVSLTTF
jgi:hypothetical protein